MTEELRDKLEKAHDAAWEAYQKVAAPAYEAYQKALDSANEAYTKKAKLHDLPGWEAFEKDPTLETSHKVMDSITLNWRATLPAAKAKAKALDSANEARRKAIDRATAAYEKVEGPAREVYEKLREELEEKLRAKYGVEASDD